jgi:hypothetical protein
VLHPSSGIWLAGSVRFSIWLDWFQKIVHLANIGGGPVAGQPEPNPQKKSTFVHQRFFFPVGTSSDNRGTEVIQEETPDPTPQVPSPSSVKQTQQHIST